MGSYGQDAGPRYKVLDFRIAIEIGCVRIRPGDILFGDIDGILVVPAEAKTEAFSKALEKVRIAWIVTGVEESLVEKDGQDSSDGLDRV